MIASEVRGDHAYVLLDTGTATDPYPYGVHCERERDQWFEGSSSNGGGWSLTDEDAETGTLAYWDVAPPGANAVKLKFKRQRFEIPVRNGLFLLGPFLSLRHKLESPIEIRDMEGTAR